MKSQVTLGVALAAMLAMATPSQAQQDEITAKEVEGYFKQLQEEATEIMRDGDMERIDDWTERNLAKGATFQASISVLFEGERKAFSTVTLDTEDMTALRGLFMGGMEMIQDYAVNVEVSDVVPHGPGAATARVTWSDGFFLGPVGEGAETEPGPDFEPLSVERVFSCVHVVQRNGENLQLGLTTCSGEVRV